MKKHLTAVRLLLMLAMMCTLIVIATAPASANVTAVTVTPAPATAGDVANYTVAFNVGAAGALTANVDAISITFPAGTTLPTTIGKLLATVNGIVLAVDPVLSGQTVILITPVAVPNNGAVSVVIAQNAGIINPPIAKTLASQAYPVTVYTSEEPLPVTGYLGIIPSYRINPTSGSGSTPVTVTGKGWTPNGSIAITGALSGTGVTLANGSFSLSAMPQTSGPVGIVDSAGQTESLAVGGLAWDYAVTVPTFTLLSWVDPPILQSPGSSSPPGEIIDTFAPEFSWQEVTDADYYGLYVRDKITDKIVFDSEKHYGPIYNSPFMLPTDYKLKVSYYKWDMASHSSAGWSYERDDGGDDFSDDMYFTTVGAGLKGIDVYHGQGIIEWSQVYEDGYRFAFVKATTGIGNKLIPLAARDEGEVLQHNNNGISKDGYSWWYVTITHKDVDYTGWIPRKGIEKLNPAPGEDPFTVALEPGNEVKIRKIKKNPKNLRTLRSTPELIEISPGVSYIDDKLFIRNITKATDVEDMLVGAYHFACPDLTLEGEELENQAEAEARHFIAVAGDHLNPDYLRPALDVEDDGVKLATNKWISAFPEAKEKLTKWIHKWMQTIEDETGGIKPILYSNSNFATNYFDESVNAYDLWFAWYPRSGNPNLLPKSSQLGIWQDKAWDFWQYCECPLKSVQGISTKIDMDLFNGDMSRLETFKIDFAYAASGIGLSFGPSQLYVVKTGASGSDALIGTIQTASGFKPVITDVALAPGGNLYGISFGALYLIDKSTALATPIGSGLGVSNANALAFDATGKLFGATTTGAFLRIDTISGSAAIIGNYGSGFGSSGDLAFASDGSLYATVNAPAIANDVLVEVDPSTAIATRVDPGTDIGWDNVFGLISLSTRLLAVTTDTTPGSPGVLIEIDTHTGSGIFVRNLTFDALGAAYPVTGS